jgi:hypothetical protein
MAEGLRYFLEAILHALTWGTLFNVLWATLLGIGVGMLAIDMPDFWLGNTNPDSGQAVRGSISMPCARRAARCRRSGSPGSTTCSTSPPGWASCRT